MYDDWKIDEPNLWAGGISDPVYIKGTGANHTGSTSGDYIRFYGSRATLHGNGGNDRIDVSGNNLAAYGDGGDDMLATYHGGSYSTLYGGIGNDTLWTNTEGVYADGGAGNDTFYVLNSASDVTCAGGDGDDLFWFIRSTGGISIEGGTGSNTYRFDPYYLNGPYHNDIVITDFTNDDTIEYFADYGWGNGREKSDGSELDYYYNSDGNLVLYDAGWDFFTITLEGITQENVSEIAGAKYVSTKKTATLGQLLDIDTDDGKVIVNAAGTEAKITAKYKEDTFNVTDYGASIKTIDASETSQGIYITGNGLANKIIGGSGNDTIYAGKGTDTLTGGKGSDVFIYKSDDGKNVITDYAAGDKISLGAAYDDATLSGKDVVFKIGKGTLTVKNAKGKTLTLIDSRGATSKKVFGGSTTLTLKNSSSSSVKIGDEIEKVNATSRTKAIKITGNALNNSIGGGSKNDTINGGGGKDTILGNSGNDKLYGQAGNDKLYGGKGNDSLWGGAGNDSLWGNSGKDIFIYKPGEGTDKIMDYWYGDGDMLKILKSNGTAGGSFKSSNFDGDALTLTINGGGKIIFDEVSAGDKFNINGKTYTIKGRTLK